MRRIAILLSILVATAPAMAGQRSGVTMPDRVTVAGKPLTLNGMGLREATWLKVDVYVAGLYVEHPSSNAGKIIASNETKQIVLKFKRNVGHADIVKAWNEGFAKNATVPVSRLQPDIAKLNAWMPSFGEGDTLTFTFTPGQGVAVAINGQRKGVIGNDDFSRSLLSIWLGPKPPTAALKTGMLGKHPAG